MRILKNAVLSIMVITGISTAQDSQYWTHQYGTQSTLLGGCVIGSFQDLSAVYYNPAAVAQMENPTFLLSAKVYDLTWLIFKNGAGEDFDLDYLRAAPSPDILAGMIPVNWYKGHRLAYSYLTRYYFKIRLDEWYDNYQDVFNSGSGNDRYSGEVYTTYDMREDWIGITWSYKTSKNFSLGISHFGVYHAQDYRTQTITQALSDEQEFSQAIHIRDFYYYHLRLLWKVGIAVKLKQWTAGMTITTPSVAIFGTGSTENNDTQSSINPGMENDQVTYNVNIEKELKADYHNFWSAGFGFSYNFQRSTLHFSLEWFQAVPEYTILKITPDFADSMYMQTDLSVKQARKTVINFGIGYEYKINEKINAYGSFTTDFSALDKSSGDNSTVSSWDIYHFTGGTLFRMKRFILNIGLGYAYGRDYKNQLINFEEANETNQLLGDLSEQSISYHNFKFIIGFSFQFFENKTGNN